MKTSINIFIRRDNARGHEKLLVHVDWGKLEEVDVKQLAAFYILQRVRDDMKGQEESLPESVLYHAEDFLHTEPLVKVPTEFPASWTAPPKGKTAKAASKILEGMSKEDLRKLLEEFND